MMVAPLDFNENIATAITYAVGVGDDGVDQCGSKIGGSDINKNKSFGVESLAICRLQVSRVPREACTPRYGFIENLSGFSIDSGQAAGYDNKCKRLFCAHVLENIFGKKLSQCAGI